MMMMIGISFEFSFPFNFYFWPLHTYIHILWRDPNNKKKVNAKKNSNYYNQSRDE